MAKPGRSPRDPVGRAFHILSWMAGRDGGPWGVREIARALEMSPSTVQRLLRTLEDEQLIRQDAATGRYDVGVELLRLAWRASGLRSLREAAVPPMRDLVSATGETASLGLYDSTRQQTCIVEIVEADTPFRFVPRLHEWRELHTGASGRAVMAFLPEEELEAILGQAELRAATERTITDPHALREVLAQVRRDGYALSEEERRLGGAGLAAPVFGPGGQVIAEIGIGVPTQRFDRAAALELAAHVVACASVVTAGIGGESPL
ncbi:MAG: IclR family transcriptional regulator [Gaiella sp.]